MHQIANMALIFLTERVVLYTYMTYITHSISCKRESYCCPAVNNGLRKQRLIKIAEIKGNEYQTKMAEKMAHKQPG